MNKRLLFKLLPVAALAAIGVFLGATSVSKVDATVSGLSPTTFTATSGSPTTFSFSADQLTGNITVTAASAATTSVTASCTGCTFSGQGTSTVVITPPPVIGITSIFGVALSLTCTNTTLATTPVTLTATQGNSSIATGTCVGGTNGCLNALLAGCCDGLLGLNTSSLLVNGINGFNNCGCFNGLGTSSLLLNNGCGCFGLGTGLLSNGIFNNGCGCFNGFNTTALALNSCGCVTGFQSQGLLANCGCVGGINGVNTVTLGNQLFGNGFVGNQFVGNGFIGNNLAGNNCAANQVSVTVPGTATCGSTTNVLVSVRNTLNGIALDGTQVVLSSNLGTVSPNQTFTSGGIASATLLLPANAAGTATITAAAAGLTGNASIVVSCNVTPIAPAPIVLPAPIATAPIVITGPNTGDGGCFVNVCTE